MTGHPLRLAAASLLLPLAGCVSMSGLGGDSKYACAAPEGVACDSVSGTYANAVHNNLPSQQGRSSAPAREQPTAPPSGAAMTRRQMPSGIENSSSTTLRSQARVLRLWAKPWEDADGDLWDQGYVYVQVDAGRWQIDHVRQRIRDRYAPLRPPPAAAASPSGATAPEPDLSATGLGAAPGQRPGSLATPPSSFPSLAHPPAGMGNRPQ